MFEFLTIVQDDAGVAFRFKHFSRELVGWEEKDESLNFRLVRTAEREAVFENPKEDHPRRMIFRSPEPDHLTVRLEGYTDGKLEATEFLYQRVK
jgi:hypothetical protein